MFVRQWRVLSFTKNEPDMHLNTSSFYDSFILRHSSYSPSFVSSLIPILTHDTSLIRFLTYYTSGFGILIQSYTYSLHRSWIISHSTYLYFLILSSITVDVITWIAVRLVSKNVYGALGSWVIKIQGMNQCILNKKVVLNTSLIFERPASQ